MNESTIVDLVSGYRAYADADELNTSAATDAPATSPVCAASIVASKASSTWCASAAASAVGGSTYRVGC
ncbi:LxmA leader domain family RiPP [Rhodococcoides corynebacterioides]|uniref:LxmA leader domain family RiPP n=1 Tax=Rhodococcoides corynebacterioides TaxID=53972 RepID=UPI001C9B02C1|nr:LxmA leader domain family RiPP [Rhodococcus corynebacterioides]MBY6350952.1 hypothetical protein [Rhodococcus corynebacterioides]